MLRPSSIQRWDSNPQLLEHESPHITTRPGLQYFFKYYLFSLIVLLNALDTFIQLVPKGSLPTLRKTHYFAVSKLVAFI